MFNPEALSGNIKKCRNKLGLTQTELAEKMYVSGQAISKWESGQSVPDLANLTLLSDIFSTTVDKLIGHKPYASDGKVLLGIDGGVTKTEFVLCTEDGHVLNRLVLDGCNPKVCGREKTYAILKSGIDTMLMMRSDIYGIFAGISGVGTGNNLPNLRKFFESNYPLVKAYVASDINNVASSVTGVDRCAAAICSAGFSVVASVGDEIHQIGGWGYILDSMGGYGIACEAMRAVLAENDGFGEKTLLTELMSRVSNDEIRNSMDRIHTEGDGVVMSLVPVVFEAYTAGDKVAHDILDKVTDEMLKILKYAFETYDCGNNVVMAGGLFENSCVLVDIITRKLGDKFRFIIPELPPIFGACVKACRLYGEMKDGFFDNFKNTYN